MVVDSAQPLPASQTPLHPGPPAKPSLVLSFWVAGGGVEQRGGSFPCSPFLPQPQPQEAGSLRDAERHQCQVWEQNTFRGSSKDTVQL